MAISVAADVPAKRANVKRAAHLRPFTEKKTTPMRSCNGAVGEHARIDGADRICVTFFAFLRHSPLFRYSLVFASPGDLNGPVGARQCTAANSTRSRTSVMCTSTYVMRTLLFIGNCRKNKPVTTK